METAPLRVEDRFDGNPTSYIGKQEYFVIEGV
jgi:hypothetical protein